jgi:hypothetical protein
LADVRQLYSHTASRGNPEKVQVCAWKTCPDGQVVARFAR